MENTCSRKENSNSETAFSKSVKKSSLDSETEDVHAIKYKISKAKERCMAYFRSLHSHLQVLSKKDLKGTHNYFVEYTGIEVKQFKDTLLQHISNIKKSVAERTRHQRQYDRRVNKREMQTQESIVNTDKALDTSLVVIKSSGTESEVQDTSSRPRNDTDTNNADIRPIYDEEPMAEVQLTTECNVFATGQQHIEQPEFNNEGGVNGRSYIYLVLLIYEVPPPTYIPLRPNLGVLQIGIKSQGYREPDIGSTRVDGPPVMLEDPYAYVVAAFQAPPSPNYVSDPKYPPSPDVVPEPVYLEFMPLEDEVLLAEEQPLPAAVSPIADSPGYVPESDPEEDPEEDDDEDHEEDLADYPADGGDDGDDEDESSDDDEDDDVDIEGDEEEEEHPASADFIDVALLAVDHAPSVKETEPFEIDESVATPPPHPSYRVARLLAIPIPPPSPLSPWSSPLPQIPSPPLPPILSPLPVSSQPPASPTYPLGYRAVMIRLRAEAPSTSHSPPPHIILSYTRADTPLSGTPPLLPIPVPTSSPSLLLPSADHRVDRLEVGESSSAAARPTGGFRADYGLVATMDREIRSDLKRDVGYGITDTWDEMLVDMLGASATDDTELGRWMTEFSTRVRQDTDEIYVRRAHARITLLMEREARMSRDAWGRFIDASDLARSEVMSLRTTVLGQQAADRRRQAAITELLAADRRR
ncbi:hypothetical protein Tco_0719205 [Tanacetum coccineum]